MAPAAYPSVVPHSCSAASEPARPEGFAAGEDDESSGVGVSEALAAELMQYAREHLAHYMAPRSLDFIEEMPRLPTGKLYKRVLRDAYWQGDRKI